MDDDGTLFRAYRDAAADPHADDLAAAPRDLAAMAIDKATRNLALLPEFRDLRRLRVREASAETLGRVGRLDGLEDLRVFGARVADLGALAGLGSLRALSLHWSTTLTGIDALRSLRRLELLSLGDFRRMDDFAPVADLPALRGFAIHAGLWADQRVRSLDFLRRMPGLEELRLSPVRVGEGGLRPVCALGRLRWLFAPNTLPIRECVRLKVCLPRAASPIFAPFTIARTAQRLDDASPDGFAWVEEVMLTGRPVRIFPRAHPRAAAWIAERQARFDAWEAHFRACRDPAADETETIPGR